MSERHCATAAVISGALVAAATASASAASVVVAAADFIFYDRKLFINHRIKKPFGQLPLKALHTKPSRQLELLSPRPMGSTPLPTSAKSIGVAGCNGRQQVTISEYIARLQLDQPEGAVLMADEVAWHMSSKRLRTAVERTLGWFAEFRALSRKALTDNADDSVPSTTLFGVVVGGHSCGAEHLERQILAYMEGGVTGTAGREEGGVECDSCCIMYVFMPTRISILSWLLYYFILEYIILIVMMIVVVIK